MFLLLLCFFALVVSQPCTPGNTSHTNSSSCDDGLYCADELLECVECTLGIHCCVDEDCQYLCKMHECIIQCNIVRCEGVGKKTVGYVIANLMPFLMSLFLANNILARVDFNFNLVYYLPAEVPCIGRRGLVQQITGAFLCVLVVMPFLTSFALAAMIYLLFETHYVKHVAIKLSLIYFLVSISLLAAYFGARAWRATKYRWPLFGAWASAAFVFVTLTFMGLWLCIEDGYYVENFPNDSILTNFLGLNMIIMSYAAYCARVIYSPLQFRDLLELNQSRHDISELKGKMEREQQEKKTRFLIMSFLGLIFMFIYGGVVLHKDNDISGFVTLGATFFADQALFFGQLHGNVIVIHERLGLLIFLCGVFLYSSSCIYFFRIFKSERRSSNSQFGDLSFCYFLEWRQRCFCRSIFCFCVLFCYFCLFLDRFVCTNCGLYQ